MKQDLRMNAKSPDPDDLAREELPQPDVDETVAVNRDPAQRAQPDRSAPHIPPVEKGKIKGE
jgi:hypothetical protein